MKTPRVVNRKSDYISRSKIGTKDANQQVVPVANRENFEARPDGYFIWTNTKKTKT